MKRFSLLLIFSLITGFAFSQSMEAMKKIESARIALITQRLDLTPKQAEKFWPIYNELSNKRKALRQKLVSERKGVDPSTLSEEEGKELMAKTMALKQQELDLEKDYSDRLLKVISAQQLFELKKAERDFRDMLLRRLQERRGRGGLRPMRGK